MVVELTTASSVLNSRRDGSNKVRLSKENPSSGETQGVSYLSRTPLVPLNANYRVPSRLKCKKYETTEICPTTYRCTTEQYLSESSKCTENVREVLQIIDTSDDFDESESKWITSNSELLIMNTIVSRPCSSPVDEIDSIVPGVRIGSPTTFASEYATFVSRSCTNSPVFKDIKENQDCDDEDNFNEEPVDYSQKYSTEDRISVKHSKLPNNNVQRDATVSTIDENEVEEENSEEDIYGDYAETDLDQPTNYSLRYTEDDPEEDAKSNSGYFAGGVDIEDTVMTYYTEGTPYETPFNFSTATSMSDLLRIDEETEGIVTSKRLNIKLKSSEKQEKESQLKEDLSENTEDTSVNSEEKPSIHSPEAKKEIEIEERTPDKATGQLRSLAARCDKDREGKMVTFGGEDHYTQETPLMFSRCSSLGSLSGFEQHSINDDRSSVISDFSRRTSGVVSPSELPDSPTQTVPPSPRQISKMGEFVAKRKLMLEGKQRINSNTETHDDLAYCKSLSMKCSIFEDDLAAFNDESTPRRPFSAAASDLSSLTIDDDDDNIDSEFAMKVLATGISNISINPETFKTPDYLLTSKTEPLNLNCNNDKIPESTPTTQDNVSDSDEDDEGILAACINMGMQTNKYRQSFKIGRIDGSNDNSMEQSISIQSPLSKPIQYDGGSSPVQHPNETVVQEVVPLSPQETPPKSNCQDTKSTGNIVVTVPQDTVHIYCTEDTPAYISPFGSQSNLSALSMPSIPDEIEIELAEDEVVHRSPELSEEQKHLNNTIELSDEGSNSSGDEEKILYDCIRSGIPKVRQTPSPLKADIASPSRVSGKAVSPGTQNLPESVCRTPSSSPADSSTHHRNKSFINSNKTHRFQRPNPKVVECNVENGQSDDSDSRAHSEDEAILESCIKSAMPKVVKLDASLSPHKSSPGNLSNWRSPARFSSSPKSSKRREHNPYFVDVEEEDDDMMLAQCIRSGMPKALSVCIPQSQSPVPNGMQRNPHQQQRLIAVPEERSQNSIELLNRLHYHGQHSQHASKDEFIEYGVEDTPCNVSIISELSSLSLNTSDERPIPKQSPKHSATRSDNRQMYSPNPDPNIDLRRYRRQSTKYVEEVRNSKYVKEIRGSRYVEETTRSPKYTEQTRSPKFYEDQLNVERRNRPGTERRCATCNCTTHPYS